MSGLRDHIQTAKNDRKQKPTAREFLRERPDADGKAFFVDLVDLTRNADWMRIQTSDFVGFVHADSDLAEGLLSILEKSDSKWGYALIAVLDNADNKYKFSISLDKNKKRFYRYSEVDKSVSISDEEKKHGKQVSLSLEDFGFTELKSDNIDGKDVTIKDGTSDIGSSISKGKSRSRSKASALKTTDI